MNFNTEMCPCDQRYKMLSGIVSPRLQPDVICDGQQHLEEHFHDTPEHYQEHFHETPLLHSTNVTSSSDCTSNKLHSDMVVSKPPLDHRNSTSHKATYISGGKLKLKATTSTSDKHVRWKEKDARISPVASDNKENGEEYPERPPRSHKETVREFRRRMKQRIAQEHQQQILSSDGRPNSAREHRTETLRHKRRQPEPFGKTQAWPSEKDISSQSMSRKQDIGNYDTATLHHSSSHSEPVSESVGKKNVEINSKTRLTSKSLDDLDISYVNYQDTLNKDKTNTNTPNTTVVHGIKPNSSSVNSESYHKIVNSQAHSPEKLERLRSPDALSRQHNKAARDSRHQTAIVNMAHLVQPESNAPRQKVGGGRQRSFSDLGFKTKDMLQTPRTMALLQNPAFRKHITKTLDLTDETSEQEVKETIEKRFEALKMGSAHSTHLRQSYSQDRVTRSHPPLKMCQSDSNIVSQMHSYARTLKRETSNESVFQSDGEENMPNSANQTQTQENTGAKNNCKTESTNLKADISRHRIPSYTQFKSQRRQNGLRSLSGSAEVLVPEAIAEEEGVKVQHRPVSASNIPSSRSRSVSNNVSKSSPDTNKFRTSDYVFTTTPEDLSLMSRSLETVNIPKRPWRKRSRKLSNSAENPISTLTQEQHKTALSKSQSVDTFKQFKQDSLLIKEDKLLTKSQSQSDNLDKTERIPKAPPRKSKKRDGLFVSKSTSSLYGMNKKTNHRRHNSQEDEVILDFTTLEGSVTEQPPTANEVSSFVLLPLQCDHHLNLIGIQ